MQPLDRRRSVLNERPVPNEQLFDPLPPQTQTTKTAPSYRPAAPPTVLSATACSTAAPELHAQRQSSSRPPKQPTPASSTSPAESAASAKMTQHSMSIPERITSGGGSISDFMAEVAALFWFESTKLLEKVEGMQRLVPGAPFQSLAPTAVASQHFKKWVSTVLTTTQVTQNVVILALLYIHRLKKANPTVKGRPGSEYRLLTVALMLGNKFLDDNTYTNKTWADVSGISVNEIHVMEVEFLSNMRYSLLVSADEWEQWLDKLTKFWSYLELAQHSVSPTPSPLLIPSPTHRSFGSPLHSPTVPLTPGLQSTTHSFALQSPNLAPMASSSQNWPVSYGSNAISPLALKPQPHLHRKRSFPEGDSAEHPAKRASRIAAGQGKLPSQAPVQYPTGSQAQFGLPHPSAIPVQSRPAPGLLADHGRQHVPSLTLNTTQATDVAVTQPQVYASAYAAQQAPLSLPPLASGVRAMSMVFPTTTYAPSQPIPATCGAMTPTASFPPMTYGTPTKRLSPQNTLAAYPGSSPLVMGNGGASGLHTPISHSPSIYLQQRNSPYRPVRHVNTLLYPPPSAFLQQYHLPNPVLPNQMHYQPLGKRNEYRTGIVPEFIDSVHRLAAYGHPPPPVPQVLPTPLPHAHQPRAQYQLPPSARAGAPYPGQY
ncbi:cyclin-domain-containing protein [Parachaetomium inaequale]|uniref:Cyclin-domain-containing protein n=1 Tax=Parachaetomium inaequale TaxID=2588326 RepID=A0AAN6P6D2_9PEZI|nr:cyclin-domain-containing protein [Parachaetomium inaequale]